MRYVSIRLQLVLWNLACLVALLTVIPVAKRLPVNWGWENGPLENFQVALLVVGGCFAVLAALAHRADRALLAVWTLAALFWIVASLRELSWGAVFLEPLKMTETGPVFSSQLLWYKPFVVWVCAAALLCVVVQMARARVWSRVVMRMFREHAWPWGPTLLFVLGCVVSACAEGHLYDLMPQYPHTTRQVAEEYAEVFAYLAIFIAQIQLARTTLSWQAAERRAMRSA